MQTAVYSSVSPNLCRCREKKQSWHAHQGPFASKQSTRPFFTRSAAVKEAIETKVGNRDACGNSIE